MKENKSIEECVPQVINEGTTSMTGKLRNGTAINILGYDFELNRIDCNDGKTHVLDDFIEFTMSADELLAILK